MITRWLNKWQGVLLSLAIGGFAACVLTLITMFWDDGAGFLHLYSTEIVLGEILAGGVLVWLTRKQWAPGVYGWVQIGPVI